MLQLFILASLQERREVEKEIDGLVKLILVLSFSYNQNSLFPMFFRPFFSLGKGGPQLAKVASDKATLTKSHALSGVVP